MFREIGAVVAGLIAGGLVNMVVIVVNTFVFFPPPPGTDFADPAQVESYVQSLPTLAFLVTMAAHLGQALVGGAVAARLSDKPLHAALAIGVLALVGGAMNLASIGGPSWMAVELPLYLVAAGLVGWAETTRRRRISLG